MTWERICEISSDKESTRVEHFTVQGEHAFCNCPLILHKVLDAFYKAKTCMYFCMGCFAHHSDTAVSVYSFTAVTFQTH